MVAPEVFKPKKEFKELVAIPEEVIFPETTKEGQERLEKNYGKLIEWAKKIKNLIGKEKPTVSNVPGFELEEEELELAEKDIEILETGIVRERAKFLEKVSEALGSAYGGWYEDRETKERYYLKFYENPDQAKVEYVANKIYERLGLPVVESELVEIEGKLAIANREVTGAEFVSKSDLQKSKEIKDGFIADAYLANWDVIGLAFDNIVKGADGRFYRIDNGGSLFFRARGEIKEYSPDFIPELVNMTNPDFSSGQIFASLSEFEKKQQAEKLIEKLDDEFLETTVKRAGFKKAEAEALLFCLKERKKYLKKRFIEVDPALLMKELMQIPVSRMKKEGVLPQIEKKADREIVEHQQIDFVSTKDKILAYFKIREQFLSRIKEQLWKLHEEGKVKIELFDKFEFKSPYDKKLPLRAVLGYKISPFKGVDIHFIFDGLRALIGQVAIEIDKKLTGKEKAIMAEIDQWFKNLGITKLWEEPPEKYVDEFIENRYLWHHKLKEMPVSAKEKLNLEEVFPGYITAVEKEKHKEYQEKYGVKGLFIKVRMDSVPVILRQAGLMSARERHKRGIIPKEPETLSDFQSGGADYVFCRTVNETALKTKISFAEFFPWANSTIFVIDPKELDRTDWFAYLKDCYGSTEPEKLEERPTPDDFFKSLEEKYSEDNEIMFQRGIRKEALLGLVVGNDQEKKEMINLLKRNGIEEVNGVPLDEYIKVATRINQVFK